MSCHFLKKIQSKTRKSGTSQSSVEIYILKGINLQKQLGRSMKNNTSYQEQWKHIAEVPFSLKFMTLFTKWEQRKGKTSKFILDIKRG